MTLAPFFKIDKVPYVIPSEYNYNIYNTIMKFKTIHYYISIITE